MSFIVDLVVFLVLVEVVCDGTSFLEDDIP